MFLDTTEVTMGCLWSLFQSTTLAWNKVMKTGSMETLKITLIQQYQQGADFRGKICLNYAATFLFLIYKCIIVQRTHIIAGMAAKYKYLFVIFIPRSQMFSQTLKPTFCQFHQFKCLTIFEMLFGQQLWWCALGIWNKRCQRHIRHRHCQCLPNSNETDFNFIVLSKLRPQHQFKITINLFENNNKDSLKSFVR